jgi:predicted phosphodiesterase
VRFLCASDLHLGRRPGGIPDHLGLDMARLATTTVWDALVELALAEQVDAVLLAGNVIDRENRLFEPIGPFERGLTTLGHHDIPVYAIAGDHDFDVLRRIAGSDDTGTFRVVGGDGRWEQVPLESGDDTSITLVAWSAPARSHPGTPLAGFSMPEHPDQPVIAMLHASIAEERPVPGDYAPVTRNDLGGWPVDLWIAGHGHTPHFDTDDVVPLLKPGSGSPLDPRERGPRGAWIVDFEQTETARTVGARHVPLAPVRFSDVALDVTGVADLGEIETRLVRAVHDTLTEAIAEDPGGHLVCVGCNLTVRGRTPAHAGISELVDDLARTLDVQDRSVIAAITSVTIDTRPDIDLEPLVGRPDPVGEVARLLQSLDSPGLPHDTGPDGFDHLAPAQQRLLQQTATQLQAVHRARVFASIAGDPEPDLATAATLLRREGWTILDALIHQRGME